MAEFAPKYTAFFGATAIWLGLDQLSKFVVRQAIPERAEGWSLIPNYLGITHAENKGAAFSFLADYEHRMLVFLALTIVSAIGLAIGLRLLDSGDRLLAAALGVLFSGVMGNAIDRAVAGHVTDMIKVYAGAEPLRSFFISKYGTNIFPIFNVADSAIWVGVVGFVLALMRVKDRGEASESSAEGSAPTLE